MAESHLALLDQMAVNVLAVLVRTCLPLSHSTLIKTESRPDALERTPLAKQAQHHTHPVRRCPQPIEGCPGRGRKGPPTGTTAVPLLLPTMDMDITQPTLSPVGTVWVVTELIMWVHRQSPLDASSKLHLKDLPWIHPFSTSSITHHG